MWLCSASSVVQLFAAAVMWLASPHEPRAHTPVRLFVGSLTPQSVSIGPRGIVVTDAPRAVRDTTADTIAVIREIGRAHV